MTLLVELLPIDVGIWIGFLVDCDVGLFVGLSVGYMVGLAGFINSIKYFNGCNFFVIMLLLSYCVN